VQKYLQALPDDVAQAVNDSGLSVKSISPFLNRDPRKTFFHHAARRETTRWVLLGELTLSDVDVAALDAGGHRQLAADVPALIGEDLKAMAAAAPVLRAPDEHAPSQVINALAQALAALHSYKHIRGWRGGDESSLRLVWKAAQSDWHQWRRYSDEAQSGVPAALRHAYNPNSNAITQIAEALNIESSTVGQAVLVSANSVAVAA
jgi:hypothetical protein